MPSAERERQKYIQAETVRNADEAVEQFKKASVQLDRRLDQWHEMRRARRFTTAVQLAKFLDADLKRAGSDVGRAGLAQVALVLAEELASTPSANVSLELAQFSLRVASEVEFVDAPRAALLIDHLSRQFAGPMQAALALREAIAIQRRQSSEQDPKVMVPLYLSLATAEREMGNPRLSLAALRALPADAGQRGAWPLQAIEEVAAIYSEAGLYDLAWETLLRSTVVFLSLLDPSVQWAADPPNSNYSSVRALGLVESILRAQGRFEDALGINRIRVQRLFRGTPPAPADMPRNPGYAVILRDEALTMIYTGQYAAASQVLEKAFWHAENNNMRSLLLSTRALLSSRLGLHAQAVEDSREGIRIANTRIGADKASLASSLSHLGRYAEAEAAFEDAFADLTSHLPSAHPDLADLRVRWAEARLRAGQAAEAVLLLDSAINDLQATLGFAHWRVSRALAVRAEAAIELRDIDVARTWATRALSSAYAGGLSEWRSTADHVTSRALALAGSNALAIFFAKRAVNELQHARSHLTGLDAQWQVSHMKARYKVFENAAALLIDAGRIPEAQQVLSMYKLDELQQFTQRSGSEDPRDARASVDGAETRWQISIDASASRLGAASAELSGLETLLRLGGLDASQARRREQLLDIADDEQLRFRRTLDVIRLEAEASQRDLERNARTAAERADTALRSLVSRLSAQSGSETAALQYIVLDHKVYVLVTTPQLQFSKEIPLRGKSLGQQVQDFRKALADRRVDPRPAGGELYSLLLGQVAPQLEAAGVRNLMISLTGVLRYVPFAALHDGSAYVVERYRISLMSEAALTLGMQAPQPTWNVAGLGVSVKVDPDFLPLPGVIDELAAVVRRAPGMASGAMPGGAWIDGDFTAERLQLVIRNAPAVIHVASHFRFAPGSDTNSFLLLGDGTRLTLRELMGARYRFGASDLLTLSACETGVDGGRDIAGREVEGLAALAQRQGAPAVLATLWPVADASTALFMQRFYTLRQQGGLSKSEALRHAQVEMLRDERAASGEKSPADPFPRYSHPFFWAPFVLLGNWL